MLNEVTLVGRLDWVSVYDSSFQIIVNRTAIKIYATNKIINAMNECCENDEIISVKAEITREEETYQQIIKAIKISFLSSNKQILDKYNVI